MAAAEKIQLIPWSATNFFSVTPSDSVDLGTIPRGIYVGVSGDLACHDADGDSVTFVNLASGVLHPLSVRRVLVTGTTATDILGVS